MALQPSLSMRPRKPDVGHQMTKKVAMIANAIP